ncbi:MAG: hypothetical protein Q8N23_02575 [Archangium sp.]|nr:hypothetical protein [Archangium sp.]MDP3151526.1 hypothetical protein [Archangium sp.]MDP3573956.1 hypothetical protein [Archangium sp.]
MGATFGAFRTLLLFTDLNRRLEQLAVSVSLEYRVAERITLVGAAGAMIAGNLGNAPTQPGGVASLALSFLVLEQGTYTPFLQFSGSIAVSAMRAADLNYVAIDFRGGLAAGWTLFERFTPYAVVRAFGGPVFYGSAIGTDAYHVQLGAGFVVGLPLGLDLSAEIIPLGEQRVTAGLGISF